MKLKIETVIKNIYYTFKASFALLIVMILIIILTPPALLIVYTIDKQKRFYLFCTKLFIKLFFLLNFINLKKRIDFNGIKKPGKDIKRIYVLNHQSILDGLVLFMLPGNVKFMANELYAKIPVFGLGISLTGNVLITRNNEGEFLSQYDQAQEILDKKYPLAVFPEGTRETSGKIGKFYNGAFKLALEKQTEIVPVVLDTWNTLRPKSFIIRDNDFNIHFLDLIKYDDYKHLNYKELSNFIKYQMMDKLITLRKEKIARTGGKKIFEKQLEIMMSEFEGQKDKIKNRI